MEEGTVAQPQPGSGHPVAEAVMRRVLCIPCHPARPDERDTSRMFTTSMALTGLRCIFTYTFLPILTPALGAVVGPAIGIPLSGVAVLFDIRAIRGFWRADHPQRWLMTVLYLVVMGFVIYLLVRDLAQVIR